ncbi:anti-phage deoxyguanosine triphosphatase [Acinetobacter pollinis]|uniref:anti-phage deoxyguanosine triphosphatase n=1 Tax=Acinetobacter pollinis TaxID=2605270 RepID=UPI0018A25E4E|nr:anti-phage deoxyguanosine triphosphatase [Acinetobacter pollinis]MBF7691682.1 deoxyguanosinetriphosphate triphosphohydrolase family protein [Acinetobacter pollinis]MBF7698702.1 deoxyguanosinetriphosphate triphosphohydrolase family protein [Acinetobacter pollinis]
MKENPWEERIYKQPKKKNDVRNEWERDYSRLINSAAFRRLQTKTQVLGLGESDFYRTRLTHSMEVAQIGVGIVKWLKFGDYSKKLKQKKLEKILPSSALINAICLAHDLGHPPFGHGGEVALNICMRDYGGFEGNGQTLRILTKLEKYSHENGLNPTRRLLLGVLKYPVSYSSVNNCSSYEELSSSKWLAKADLQKPPKCYLDSEKEVVSWVLKPFKESDQTKFQYSTPTERHNKPSYHSLDASIMELADDISYSLHDLEDAISLGLVKKEDWEDHKEKKSYLFKNFELNSYQSISDLEKDLFSKKSYLRKKAIGELVQTFIMKIYLHEVPGFNHDLLKWNATMDTLHLELQKHICSLVYSKVIKSTNVQLLEFKGQKLIVELFEIFKVDPFRLLPKSALTQYESIPKEHKNERMRIICDYIAGMTDEYATKLYEKIYHPHKGSIFDRL